MSRQTPGSVRVSVRVSHATKALWVEAATRAGMPLRDFVLAAVKEKIETLSNASAPDTHL
jgi:uncharacterized protein (DUF1778 family)